MANRVATTADTTNTIYTNWISANIVPYHGSGCTMQVGDVILDDKDSANATYIRQDWRYLTEWHHAYVTDTGNTSGNTIYLITTTIDTDLPSEGVVVVEDGSGGFDYYHYSSYSGSSFTLDTTDHPTGLVRTYGSEDSWATRFRIGATWWLDGVEMGMDITNKTTWNWFRFLDGNGESWKYISTNDKPITFRPLRGQVIFNSHNSTGIMFSATMFDNVVVDGECVAYPGFRNISETDNFIHGTFGFLSWDDDDAGDHCFSLDYGTNALGEPSYKIIGVEAIGGFSGFRVCLGGTGKDIPVKSVELRRCYRHDAAGGEGTYFGTTSGSNEPLFQKIIMEDNLLVRCAAESVQVEEQINVAQQKLYRNNTIMGGANDFLSPFQSAQSNSWQINFGDGNALITKNICGGSIDNGIIQFGNSYGTGSGKVKLIDNLFLNNRSWLYIHNSTLGLTGLTFEWQRMYYTKQTTRNLRSFAQLTAASDLIGDNNGDASWIFKQLEIDTTTNDLNMFQTESNTSTIQNVSGATIPDVEFVNSGLDYNDGAGTNGKFDYLGIFSPTKYIGSYNGRNISGITNNGSGIIRVITDNSHYLSTGDSIIISKSPLYAGYYPNAVQYVDYNVYDVTGVTYVSTETGFTYASDSPPIYYKDEIVSEINANSGVTFFQCTADPSIEPTSLIYTPSGDTLNWDRIYWDSGGTRSDMTGYTGTPDPRTGGNFPPDDLRIKEDNYWSGRGFGVRFQEHYEGYEKYRWYVSDDISGTTKTLIPEAKESTFDITDPTYIWVYNMNGKYLFGSVQLVNDVGALGVETFTLGQLITPTSAPLLFLEAISTNVIDVTWSSVDNVASYSLERDESPSYSGATEIYSGTLLTYRDEGLSTGITYYYRIKAIGSIGDGDLSSEWTTGNQTVLESGLYSYPVDNYSNDATNPNEYYSMGLL